MRANIKIITAPTTYPVTLDEAKAHCRIDLDDEDDLIQSLIMVATEWAEKFQNRAYITQTLEASFDDFPSDVFCLPRPPLQTITSIKYIDSSSVEHTVDTGIYYADTNSDPGRVSLKYSQIWPTDTLQPINAVRVRYTAGYGAASAVPKSVKQAILLLVGHWYNNREATGSDLGVVEFAVKSLLGMDRVVPV